MRWACAVAVGAAAISGLAAAAPVETPSVATLPDFEDHWIWVTDRLLQHSILFDGDSGEVLGMVDSAGSLTPKAPVLSRSRGEVYSADLAYSRGTRGERVDFVTIYDARTLGYEAEILLPVPMGQSNTSNPYAELLGERFFAIFNQFPNTSVSIVDLERREFVEEILITGCSGIYPVNERRFATLCGDGTALQVDLDPTGRKSRFVHATPFFDVVADPVAMAAGRDGSAWVFVSFEGVVHRVDFSGDSPSAGAPWSLVSSAEREAGWRPGGLQHVAVHGASQRLFVVMHQGESGSHKEAGPEIWVFDLAAKRRVMRIEPPNLTAAFLASFARVPADSFVHDFLSWVVPDAGVHTIAVSRDDAPLLFARSGDIGAVAVIDAHSGETLRILTETGLAGPTLRVP